MKTTEVIVEILVIGFGPLVSLAICIVVFPPSTAIDIPSSPVPILIATGCVFCYVFGVIVDRVADAALSSYEKRIRSIVLKGYGSQLSDFQDMRSYVYQEIPHVREWAEYGRIRLRVSRGWVVNALLILGSLILMHIQSKDFFIGKSFRTN